MKRKKLCLAGYALAAFAAVGCAQKQNYEVFAANPVQSPPEVQQKVAAAHEAELKGDTDRALAMYREVLEADPNNDWSRSRVERLSGELPTLAARRYERVTGQPAPTPDTRSTNDTEIQRVAADTTRPKPAMPKGVPAISNAAPATESVALKKPTDRSLTDWLNEQSTVSQPAEVRPAVAEAKIPAWAKDASTQNGTSSSTPADEFEWARDAAVAASQHRAARSTATPATTTPATPASPTTTPSTLASATVANRQATPSSIDDESIFDALERRENPFENLANADSIAKAVEPRPKNAPSSDRFAWASDGADQVVQAASSTPQPTDIKRVAFAPSRTEKSEGTPLVELCRDANVQVLSLVRKLESPLATVRREGLNEIGLLGKKANTARLPVRILCDDPVPVVAAEAAWTLWQIDQDSFQSVRRLVKLVDSKDPEAAEIAIQSLGLIGPDATTAAPVLRSRLSSSTGLRRVRLAEALVRIQPEDTGALQALVEATRYGRVGERVDATYALAHTPAVHLNAIAPVLVNALHDEDESVRTAAALTLGSFGPAAEQARLALEAAARFDTRPVRDAARATLACLPDA